MNFKQMVRYYLDEENLNNIDNKIKINCKYGCNTRLVKFNKEVEKLLNKKELTDERI